MASSWEGGNFFISLPNMELFANIPESFGEKVLDAIILDDKRIYVGGDGFFSIFRLPPKMENHTRGIPRRAALAPVKEENVEVGNSNTFASGGNDAGPLGPRKRHNAMVWRMKHMKLVK